MDQQEEFERYERQGQFPRKEPREPLSEESFEMSSEDISPNLRGLHVPKAPLTKGKLKTFLIELKPEVETLLQMSRKDQHILATYLQEVKNLIHSSDLPKEMAVIFEKIVDHFNTFLIHSMPFDQMSVLQRIKELDKALISE